MWFAILIFVCLSVEVLSYLTGGDTSNGIIREKDEKKSPETLRDSCRRLQKRRKMMSASIWSAIPLTEDESIISLSQSQQAAAEPDQGDETGI